MPGLRNIERAARLCRHGHDGPAEEPDSDCEINQDKKTHQTPGPVPADKQDALLQAIRVVWDMRGSAPFSKIWLIICADFLR